MEKSENVKSRHAVVATLTLTRMAYQVFITKLNEPDHPKPFLVGDCGRTTDPAEKT